MISSNSVSSFYPKKASKPAKQAVSVPKKQAGLSKLPRAIVTMLASTVAADSPSPIMSVSTTALNDAEGGFVVAWAKLDGSVSSRTFRPDGTGGFIQGQVLEVTPQESETVYFPARLLSGQLSAGTLPDQIPVDKLPTIPAEKLPTIPLEKLPVIPDSKLDTVSADKLRGTIPIENLPIVPDEKLASISADKLNGTLPMQALPAATLYHNPVGSVVHYPTDTVPEDYLECNGQTVLRDAYPELFGVIGVTYGPGDSVSTFRLPDYRGQFLRGWDNNRNIGSEQLQQTDTFEMLTKQPGVREYHNVPPVEGRNKGQWSGIVATGLGTSSVMDGIKFRMNGYETRPKNIAVMYIIRAK